MTAAERSLDQKRAASALCRVREIGERQATLAESYRSYAEALPAAIVMNGLGQACATLLSRAGDNTTREKACHQLYKDLEAWLCRGKGAVYSDGDSLIDVIVAHNQERYVHAQAEALAYLDWLKKFAQAFLKGGSASAAGISDAK